MKIRYSNIYKVMDITLWIVQIMLAAVFLTFGLTKAVVRIDKLKLAMPWIENFSSEKVRLIGILESIGGFGLFFPGLYPISPIIIPLAATCLAIIMVLAAITHYNRNEKGDMILNIALFLLLSFVAIARFAL